MIKGYGVSTRPSCCNSSYIYIYIYIYKRKEGPRSNRIQIENILIYVYQFFFSYLFLLCLDIFRFSLKHKLFFKGFESEKFINNKLMFITLFKFNYFCLRFKKIMILRGEFLFLTFFSFFSLK